MSYEQLVMNLGDITAITVSTATSSTVTAWQNGAAMTHSCPLVNVCVTSLPPSTLTTGHVNDVQLREAVNQKVASLQKLEDEWQAASIRAQQLAEEKRKAANIRAKQLLVSQLNWRQFRQLRTEGGFRVRSRTEDGTFETAFFRKTGCVFRVQWTRGKWMILGSYCIGIRYTGICNTSIPLYPVADGILARKLLFQHDYAAFRRIANYTRAYRLTPLSNYAIRS